MTEPFITDYLEQFYDEASPKEFYRAVFPIGELEEKGKQVTGKYNAIAVELLPEAKDNQNANRYVVTDDLDIIDELLKSDNFIIISPISYIGRSRQSKNARFIYGLAIDVDGVDTKQHLTDLLYQIDNEILPKPTYIVSSGFGVHLYYLFDKALPCFNNITKQMANLKQDLTKKVWNKYTTTLYDKPQIQSLFQGFRLVGGVTKTGTRTRAFLTGNKVTIEYLNEFVNEENKVTQYSYKSTLTKKEAAEKYPEWYKARIIEKKPKGTWECKKDLYQWWLRRLTNEATVGHRYYSIMVLCIYAKKCNVDRETLEADAFSLVKRMDLLTTDETNHFTRADVLAALEMYNDNYITFPIDSITTLTNIPIKKNKRNYRKMADHVKLMNYIRDEINHNTEWRNTKGRPIKPTKEAIKIKEWRQDNPTKNKASCIRETGISKPTVYKYWDCL